MSSSNFITSTRNSFFFFSVPSGTEPISNQRFWWVFDWFYYRLCKLNSTYLAAGERERKALMERQIDVVARTVNAIDLQWWWWWFFEQNRFSNYKMKKSLFYTEWNFIMMFVTTTTTNKQKKKEKEEEEALFPTK